MTDEKNDDEKQDNTISIANVPILGGPYTFRIPPKRFQLPKDDSGGETGIEVFAETFNAQDDGVEGEREIENREKIRQSHVSDLAQDQSDPEP